MAHYNNPQLSASFNLPNDPDFEQITTYDANLKEAFGGKDELPTGDYCGAVVSAAAAAGLISDWTTSRDGVPLSNKPRQAFRAIIWAARCIELYMIQVKTIDPKSLAPVSPTPAAN